MLYHLPLAERKRDAVLCLSKAMFGLHVTNTGSSRVVMFSSDGQCVLKKPQFTSNTAENVDIN
jgi:hypothetical protein